VPLVTVAPRAGHSALAQAISRRSLLLSALSSCACSSAVMPSSTPSKLLGGPLPAFTGVTINGSEFDSNASLGHVMVVEFFTEACEPCEKSLVDASDLYQSHTEVVVVGVSLDESIAGARSQVERHALRFPVLHDPERRVAERLGVTDAKTSFAIDRRGILRWVGAPAKDPGAARQAAEALLGESS